MPFSKSLKDKILHKFNDFEIKKLYILFKQVSNFLGILEIFFSSINKLLIKLSVIIDERSCSPLNSLIKSSIYDANLLFNSEFIYLSLYLPNILSLIFISFSLNICD